MVRMTRTTSKERCDYSGSRQNLTGAEAASFNARCGGCGRIWPGGPSRAARVRNRHVVSRGGLGRVSWST